MGATLNNELIEGRLLHDCGNAYVRDAEEDRIHNDKAFSSRIGKGKEGGIHSIRRELNKLKRLKRLTTPLALIISIEGFI